MIVVKFAIRCMDNAAAEAASSNLDVNSHPDAMITLAALFAKNAAKQGEIVAVSMLISAMSARSISSSTSSSETDGGGVHLLVYVVLGHSLQPCLQP